MAYDTSVPCLVFGARSSRTISCFCLGGVRTTTGLVVINTSEYSAWVWASSIGFGDDYNIVHIDITNSLLIDWLLHIHTYIHRRVIATLEIVL